MVGLLTFELLHDLAWVHAGIQEHYAHRSGQDLALQWGLGRRSAIHRHREECREAKQAKARRLVTLEHSRLTRRFLPDLRPIDNNNSEGSRAHGPPKQT